MKKITRLLLCTGITLTAISACKKNDDKTTTPVTPPVPVIDTVKLLTTRQWRIVKEVSDANNNGLPDDRELTYAFKQVFTFYENGKLCDTNFYNDTVSTQQTGYYNFSGSGKAVLNLYLDSVNRRVRNITEITDTSLILLDTVSSPQRYWTMCKKFAH